MKPWRALSVFAVLLGVLIGYAAATGKIPSLLGLDDVKTAAPGKRTVAFDFIYDGPGFGKGGTGGLKVAVKEVDTKKIPFTLATTTQWDETFDGGSDTGTAVDDKDYQCPFPFTGTLIKVTGQIGPQQLASAEKVDFQKKIGERD
jgi:hypothetical protein